MKPKSSTGIGKGVKKYLLNPASKKKKVAKSKKERLEALNPKAK